VASRSGLFFLPQGILLHASLFLSLACKLILYELVHYIGVVAAPLHCTQSRMQHTPCTTSLDQRKSSNNTP
jgi:hypothetical protein